jgi:hypothetical protein
VLSVEPVLATSRGAKRMQVEAGANKSVGPGGHIRLLEINLSEDTGYEILVDDGK